MENKFIENYKALSANLKNMTPSEGVKAISSAIRENALAAKQNNESAQENTQEVPKAPSFTYKNPATDDSIAYWKTFSDEGTMRHYDDLINILDTASEMKSVDEIKNYINDIKGTTTYKTNPGIQYWVNDFESFYYPLDEKYDMSYPIDVMAYQTAKAREAFENKYKDSTYTKRRKISSPSEILPEIKSSYK